MAKRRMPTCRMQSNPAATTRSRVRSPRDERCTGVPSGSTVVQVESPEPAAVDAATRRLEGWPSYRTGDRHEGRAAIERRPPPPKRDRREGRIPPPRAESPEEAARPQPLR